MGLFDNLFKSTDKSENTLKINWLALTDSEQLEEIIKISIAKPVLIFKHSTRCGTSRMALKNFESDYDIPATEIDMYFLDLLNYRALSNDISEKFKTIRSTLYQNTQYKSVQIIGQLTYFDIITNQLIKSFPIESGYKFEHNYATYSGDKNALDQNYLDLLKYKSLPFPSNEQMIYDSGEDLKQKIKYIITNNQFR